MAEVVNNDKLELKLTSYGLSRIAEALDNPEMTLALTKVRIGSGDNYEYYVPTEAELNDPNFDLKGLISGYEFYIYDKELLEDGLTVSFHTIIPEDVGGFDIREVGLYETVNGKDHLFAISTQQPFVKPSAADNYFINVNYYMFLKIQNFADIYDRITLDIEHASVTEPDLETLLKSFLFAEENLMVQIGKNSELLGYNRPTQLLEKINENKRDYSYITLYKNFASVLDLVKSPKDIFSYWIFDQSRRESLGSSITDLSDNKYYLTTNKLSNTYTHSYVGFQSMFSFGESDFFELPASIPVNLHDPETDIDSPFTIVYAIKPPETTATRTVIAKSNRGEGQVQVFEVQELSTKALQVRLFADSSNYVTFRTPARSIPQGAHSVVITYNPNTVTMNAFINSTFYSMNKDETGTYSYMNTSAGGTFYEYSCTPTFEIHAAKDGSAGNPLVYNSSQGTDDTIYCSADGSPIDSGNWSVHDDGNLYYNDTLATVDLDNPTEVTLYAWVYQGPIGTPPEIAYTRVDTIDSENITFYDELFNPMIPSTDAFHVVHTGGDNYEVMYGEYSTSQESTLDITRYVYECTATLDTQYIYTTSTSFMVPKNNPELTYPLYQYGDGTVSAETPYQYLFELYTGSNWEFRQVGETTQSIEYGLFYNGQRASYTNNVADSPVPPLASYVISSSGHKTENIDSYVGLVSIIKEKLSDIDARVLALNLCATMGKNPFLSEE